MKEISGLATSSATKRKDYKVVYFLERSYLTIFYLDFNMFSNQTFPVVPIATINIGC